MEITSDPNHRCWAHWGIPDDYFAPSTLLPIEEEKTASEEEKEEEFLPKLDPKEKV